MADSINIRRPETTLQVSRKTQMHTYPGGAKRIEFGVLLVGGLDVASNNIRQCAAKAVSNTMDRICPGQIIVIV